MSDVRSVRPDILYVNGFFSVWSSMVPQFLARIGVVRTSIMMIAPRGEFSVGALGLKRSKKAIFVRAYRLLRFQKMVTWHASSDREAADIRRVIGQDARILIRENDTLLPPDPSPPANNASSTLSAVYVGRISPMKGLLELLSSMREVPDAMSLDIYGPEEDRDYARRCKEMARNVPAHISIIFHGPIAHSEVRATLESSDLMLMPTRGENFGHVIAEALSASCPVMVGDVTPWTSLLRAGGGAVVDSDGVGSWTEAIREYCAGGPRAWSSSRSSAARAYTAWYQGTVDRDHLFVVAMENYERADGAELES